MDNKRFHCQHCNEKISKTLYFEHKKLYYSVATREWQCVTQRSDPDGEDEDNDFCFSDAEDSTG